MPTPTPVPFVIHDKNTNEQALANIEDVVGMCLEELRVDAPDYP